MDFAGRRRTLRNELDAEAFLVVNLEGKDRASLLYLTGFFGEGAFILLEDEAVLLTDFRYTEQASREAPTLICKKVKGKYIEEVAAVINELEISTVAFAAKRMNHYWVTRLNELTEVEWVSLEDPVANLRRVKESAEIDRIREATKLTEAALSELVPKIEVGVSEQALALELEIVMRKMGAEKVAFDPIVASGENSALPHYRPGARKLQKGDLLLVDIGAQVGGYSCDLTRVFGVEEVSAQAQEIYELVLRANQAGIATVKAGAHGKSVDAAARVIFNETAYEECFGHGLGHGVGLEVHEGPSLSLLSDDTLAAGMVVTIEPGVYLPGFGGVRIEDLVVVTKDGCEVLTSFPRDRLMEVG